MTIAAGWAGQPAGQRSSQWWPLAAISVHLAARAIFRRHHGTLFHGKRVAVELIVRVLACLAEGLGIRATARVFEVDSQYGAAVAGGSGRAAARPFPPISCATCTLTQVQLDEFYAVLSAVKDGELSEAKAIKRLSRSPHWVWVAMDPVTKLLLAIDVGERTLAMAQRVVHQVAQVLAPDCAPLFLTDGFRGVYDGLADPLWALGAAATAQAKGPVPKPRWMPLPAAALCAGGQDHAAPAPGRA